MSEIKYVCNFEVNNGEKYADFIYSEDVKSLGEQFLREQINGYFGADYNDLADDLLQDLVIDGYVDVVRHSYGYSGSISDALLVLKEDLMKLLDDISFEEFKEIIGKINVQLLEIGYKNQFICFDNEEQAYKFLKKEFDIEKDTYYNVFDEILRKKD